MTIRGEEVYNHHWYVVSSLVYKKIGYTYPFKRWRLVCRIFFLGVCGVEGGLF